MTVKIQNNKGEVAEVEAWREGKGLRALCPFHGDTKPSLFIYPDGRFRCYGCNVSGRVITEELSDSEDYKTLTLEEFSKTKNLPTDFLLENFVRETDEFLIFFYLHEDGDPARAIARCRHSMSGAQRFSWQKGATPILYGLWKLRDFDRNKPLLIVEGESDTLTLWFCGFQSLGAPGVNLWKPEFAKYIRDFKRVFVIIEPNSKGKLFREVRKSCQCYPVYFDRTGYKDPSDAFISLGRDAFIDFIENLVEEAEASIPRILPVSQIQSKPVEWAIPQWFAKGVINLLAGEAGVGKTTLILNLLALASTGQGKIPIGDRIEIVPKCRSLYLSLEDDLASKVKPVLSQLGVGQSSDIYLAYAEGVRDINILSKDFGNFDIVVVDPLTNLLSDDPNKIEKVLNLLKPFKVQAKRYNIALIIVWHLNKAKDVLGSVGFKCLAKTILLLGKGEDSLIFSQSKNAFGKPLPSMKLRIDNGVVNWAGFSDTDLGELRDERDHFVKDFILSILKLKGEITFNELAKLGSEEGIKRDSLSVIGYRLKKRGIIEIERVKSQSGKFDTSLWRFRHLNSSPPDNMEQTVENKGFVPSLHCTKKEGMKTECLKNCLKIKWLHEHEGQEAIFLQSVKMGSSVEKSKSAPSIHPETVKMADQHKGIIGDKWVENHIKKLGNKLEKPPLDKFLSFLNYTSQRQREKLGLLGEEPLDLNWLDIEVKYVGQIS